MCLKCPLKCTVKTGKFTLFVYCSQNINKQNLNIADETLTDYSFLSRYHHIKSKNYLKRRYRFRHWIPMFIGTPCTIHLLPVLGWIKMLARYPTSGGGRGRGTSPGKITLPCLRNWGDVPPPGKMMQNLECYFCAVI